ncbi:MAG: hypothetical protein U1E70_01530 [Acetobacteraceae bacterium]|nr:hypothetical protein [Pseudomonadota bacterium]
MTAADLVSVYTALMSWGGGSLWASLPITLLVMMLWSQWKALRDERKARDVERNQLTAQMLTLNQEHDRFALEMSKRFDGIVAIVTDNRVMQEIRSIEIDIQSKTVEIKAMIQASILRRDP